MRSRISTPWSRRTASADYGPDAPARTSYAQCGEDLVLTFLLYHLGIERPSYVDLGAHHPYFLNNTALLYDKGFRGVNVEPDPQLVPAFEQQRPEDVTLAAAVGPERGRLDFYVMSAPTLNTLSVDEVRRSESLGYTVERVVPVDVLTVDDVFAALPGADRPDLLSVDVEGLDLEILQSVDFDRHGVPVVCVETLSHDHFGRGRKSSEITAHMRAAGYQEYADTYLNTVFVRQDVWATLAAVDERPSPSWRP